MTEDSVNLSLLEHSLQLAEERFGANHPQTAAALNNLAHLHTTIGNYAVATTLYSRALKICEEELGVDDLNTANLLYNFASMYYESGNVEAVTFLCQRALGIREEKLGADHPDSISILRFLAEKPLYLRTTKISEQYVDKDDPKIVAFHKHLAELQVLMENNTAAQIVFAKALEMSSILSGTDHPNTAFLRANFDKILTATDATNSIYDDVDYNKITKLQQALAASEAQCDEDRPNMGLL